MINVIVLAFVIEVVVVKRLRPTEQGNRQSLKEVAAAAAASRLDSTE